MGQLVYVPPFTLVLREHERLRGFGTKLFDAANFIYTYVFCDSLVLFVRAAYMASKLSPQRELLYNDHSDFLVLAFVLLKIETSNPGPKGRSSFRSPLVSTTDYNIH